MPTGSKKRQSIWIQMDHVHSIIKKPGRALPIRQSRLRNSQLLLWIVFNKTSNKWSEIKQAQQCIKICKQRDLAVQYSRFYVCALIMRVFRVLFREWYTARPCTGLQELVLNKASVYITFYKNQLWEKHMRIWAHPHKNSHKYNLP